MTNPPDNTAAEIDDARHEIQKAILSKYYDASDGSLLLPAYDNDPLVPIISSLLDKARLEGRLGMGKRVQKHMGEGLASWDTNGNAFDLDEEVAELEARLTNTKGEQV